MILQDREYSKSKSNIHVQYSIFPPPKLSNTKFQFRQPQSQTTQDHTNTTRRHSQTSPNRAKFKSAMIGVGSNREENSSSDRDEDDVVDKGPGEVEFDAEEDAAGERDESQDRVERRVEEDKG